MNLELPTADDVARVMNGDAPAPAKSVIGEVADPSTYFEQQKQEMLAKLGDTSTIRVLTNRIWIAIWMRPDFKDLGGGKKIHFTDTTRDEDIYQGTAGLVVAMGPLAFVSDDDFYFGRDVPMVGDWVLYHRGGGYGVRFRHNGVECVMLEQEKAIKAILTRPDLVE
jgi:hypothetical protein